MLEAIPKIEVFVKDLGKIKNAQEIVLNNLYNLKDYDICYMIMGVITVYSLICGYIIKPIRVFNI